MREVMYQVSVILISYEAETSKTSHNVPICSSDFFVPRYPGFYPRGGILVTDEKKLSQTAD